MFKAVKQFLYAMIVLIILLVAVGTILEFVKRKGGSSFLGRFASKVQTDSGVGPGILQ